MDQGPISSRIHGHVITLQRVMAESALHQPPVRTVLCPVSEHQTARKQGLEHLLPRGLATEVAPLVEQDLLIGIRPQQVVDRAKQQ